MTETKEEFFRDISNYILMNNDIMRLDYNSPSKLNSTPVNKATVFHKKLNFTDDDFRRLPEYDGFVCEPDHLNYQRTYGGKWNTYSRVDWDPTPGEWPTIRKLLTHIFGKNSVEEDQLEEIFDYHTLLVKKPTQTLHGRFLYSHQQKTAKSALALLEQYMFQDNYSKIRDNEFESSFNAIWVNCLILHLDEPFFENKKKMSRIIRDMVTAKMMNLRRMRTDYEKTKFFGKLLITTNDTDFMKIEQGDRRYWIREVPTIPDADRDPHFETKMLEEVNHYLHFLLNREMKYPEKVDETFWLPASIIQTNGFKKLVGDNRSALEETIVDIIEQWFIKNKGENKLYFRLKDLQDKLQLEFTGREKFELNNTKITVVLRDILKLVQPQSNGRISKTEKTLTFEKNSDKPVGKWWVAHRAHFDTEPDIFGKIG